MTLLQASMGREVRVIRVVHRSVIVRSDCIASAVRDDQGNMHLQLRGLDVRLQVSRQFQPLFKGQ